MQYVIPSAYDWTVVVTRVKQLGVLLLLCISFSALWLGQGDADNWEITFFTDAGRQVWNSHVVDVDQRIIYDSATTVPVFSDAISPDGRFMVTGASNTNERRVLVDQITGTEHNLGTFYSVTWAPASDALVLLRGNNPASVFVAHLDENGVPTVGERITTLTSFGLVSFSIEWLADGRTFLINGATMDQDGYGADIYRINIDTSAVTNLTNVPNDDQLQRVSPDGSQIAFMSSRATGNQVFLMDINGDNVRQLTDDARIITNIAWSPGGTQIAFFDLTGGFHNLRIITLLADDRYSVSAPILREQIETANALYWSPDGTRLAYSTVYGELVVVDINTGEQRSLTPAYGNIVLR